LKFLAAIGAREPRKVRANQDDDAINNAPSAGDCGEPNYTTPDGIPICDCGRPTQNQDRLMCDRCRSVLLDTDESED
jgi:hypothetical protein